MSYPTENFNEYANGSIDGLSGGTGWISSWLDPDGAYSIQSSIVHSSSKAAKGTGDGTRHDLNRTFPPVSQDGRTFTFFVYIDGNSSGDWDISLFKEGADDVAAGVQFRSGDNSLRLISSSDGGPWIMVQSYNPGQWYQIDLKLDFTNQTYQVQVDGDGYTASYGLWISSEFVNTFKIIGENPGAGNDVYLDDIGDSTIEATISTDARVVDFIINLGGVPGEKPKGTK